jgi:hypothetical protein
MQKMRIEEMVLVPKTDVDKLCLSDTARSTRGGQWNFYANLSGEAKRRADELQAGGLSFSKETGCLLNLAGAPIDGANLSLILSSPRSSSPISGEEERGDNGAGRAGSVEAGERGQPPQLNHTGPQSQPSGAGPESEQGGETHSSSAHTPTSATAPLTPAPLNDPQISPTSIRAVEEESGGGPNSGVEKLSLPPFPYPQWKRLYTLRPRKERTSRK